MRGETEGSLEAHVAEASPALPLLRTSRALLSSLAVGIIVLDQASKAAVRALLALHESVAVIPGLLSLTHVRNTGAAFGLLNSVDIPFKPVLMAFITLGALVAIGIFAMQTASDNPLARLGLALVLGGAGGNLIDRVTAGYVIDFIDVYWRAWHFWTFNVADSAITVGAILLILDVGFLNRHVSKTV